jgi:peptidoglycan/xylan/chitin deacetylase (PgdA/CDA1 family)
MKLFPMLHAAGVFGLLRALLKRRRSISVLLHGTYSRRYPEIPMELHFGMHTEDFERVLEWIRSERVRLLKLDEYLAGEPGLLLTFDDGYANNYEHALPLLEKFECPATFFLATRHIIDRGGDKWLENFSEIMDRHGLTVDEEIGYELFYGLTEGQIRKMARHPLVDLGAHTHRHVRLSQQGEAALRDDIRQCNDILSDLCGSPPEVFSYPFGDYDERCIRMVREAGFKAAFAVQPRLGRDERFELPRIGLYRSDAAYLSAKMSFLYRSL